MCVQFFSNSEEGMKKIWNKIKRKWMKLRLQPIRVFCFHQVSDVFDSSTMWKCDWTQTDQFKNNIEILQKTYTFISLEEARIHLLNDIFRVRKYAVLTCDDGWASLANIVPWIVEKRIPLMLFVNPEYFLGLGARENGMDKLLKRDEISRMVSLGKPFVQIASHGWNHQLCTEQSMDVFQTNVVRSMEVINEMNGDTRYFAYPCGCHTQELDLFLQKKKIIPVYCDGIQNYNNANVIHREPLDGLII